MAVSKIGSVGNVADPNLNALIAELSRQGLVVVDDVLTPNEVMVTAMAPVSQLLSDIGLISNEYSSAGE